MPTSTIDNIESDGESVSKEPEMKAVSLLTSDCESHTHQSIKSDLNKTKKLHHEVRLSDTSPIIITNDIPYTDINTSPQTILGSAKKTFSKAGKALAGVGKPKYIVPAPGSTLPASALPKMVEPAKPPKSARL